MSGEREPRLHTVLIRDLKPTQMTVGLHEVALKRQRWARDSRGKQDAFLGDHLVPAVHGPKGRFYVIDHHHLCRALLDEGQDEVALSVVADLSALEKDAFWVFMDTRNWLHAYDAKGKRRGWKDLPGGIADLADDPYRSLAGGVLHLGGYAKNTAPYGEFLWADFFRRHIKRRNVKADFDEALAEAFKLARSPGADFLPGWCGPSSAS